MSLQTLIGEIARLLAAAAQRDSAVAPFAELLGEVPPDSETGKSSPALPVCRYWPATLERPATIVRTVCASLTALSPRLTWTQNPNYRHSPPSPDFLDNYGYAVLAGPSDGPPALARHDQLAFGVLMLGPRTHYPLHHHPAAEVYIPLNAAEWWRGDGPWREQPPGAVIYHAPDVPHATRAGQPPLLALYLWRGELATHARLTEGPTAMRG